MNKLRLENINQHAPYRVWEKSEFPDHYYFTTDNDLEFDICFAANYSIVRSGTFEIDITNPSHGTSPLDPKLRMTLFAIIEEFFSVNGEEVMLYMTETGDGKQAFRNRLFIRWFNSYERRDRYFIKTAEGKMDGELNFMAIISRCDNPRLPMAIEEFDETVSLLFDAPDGAGKPATCILTRIISWLARVGHLL